MPGSERCEKLRTLSGIPQLPDRFVFKSRKLGFRFPEGQEISDVIQRKQVYRSGSQKFPACGESDFSIL
jgi:hypothetical protein